MSKGLIMSIEDNKKAVILTPEGEFCRVPLPKKGQYNIGDELHISKKAFFASISNAKWGMMAAAVFIMMLMPLLWKNLSAGPVEEVAYVNIDINPSIELALDSNNQVLKAKGLNHDGDKVLADLNLKDTPAQDAINKITNKAKEYNYLAANKENLVVISVTSQEKEKYQDLSSNLEKQVESNLNKFNLNGKVETISTSLEVKAKAAQLNLSPGKYAVLLAAMDAGLNISPEEIRSKSIAKAIKGIGGDVGDIVKKAHQATNFDQLSTKYAKKINKSLNKSDSKDITEAQDEDTDDENYNQKNEKNEKNKSSNINSKKNINSQKEITDSKDKDKVNKKKQEKDVKESKQRGKNRKNNKNAKNQDKNDFEVTNPQDSTTPDSKNDSNNSENQDIEKNNENDDNTDAN